MEQDGQRRLEFKFRIQVFPVLSLGLFSSDTSVLSFDTWTELSSNVRIFCLLKTKIVKTGTSETHPEKKKRARPRTRRKNTGSTLIFRNAKQKKPLNRPLLLLTSLRHAFLFLFVCFIFTRKRCAQWSCQRTRSKISNPTSFETEQRNKPEWWKIGGRFFLSLLPVQQKNNPRPPIHLSWYYSHAFGTGNPCIISSTLLPTTTPTKRNTLKCSENP